MLTTFTNYFMNYKKIAFFSLFFLLSAGFISALEKVTVDILDPMHEINVPGYVAKLEKGEFKYDRKLEGLIKKFITCHAAYRLANQALQAQENPITVLYAFSPDDIFGAGPGVWIPQFHLILIDPRVSETLQLAGLLNGLASAARPNKNIANFIQNVQAGRIGREEYVKNVERSKYDAAKRFFATADECIELNKWPKSIAEHIAPMFAGGSNAIGANFEKFWAYIKNHPETDFSRDQWDEYIKDIYCINNPTTTECADEDEEFDFILS